MANLTSIGLGGTTASVANSLASLSDTNITATPADGSILTMQSGKWAVGGKPAYVSGLVQSAFVTNNGVEGLQLQGAFSTGNEYAVSFVDGQNIAFFKNDTQGWKETAHFSADSDTGWLTLQSDYFQTIGYRKKNGVVFVELNCVLLQAVPAGADVQVGVLPEGFRPSRYATFAVAAHGGAQSYGYVYISPQGVITVGFKEGLPVGSYPDGSASFVADQ